MKKILSPQSTFIAFLKLLFSVLVIVFLLHNGILYFLGKPFLHTLIVLGYVINLVLAAIIFKALLFFNKNHTESLGYFFLYGSLLKFVAYFALFYPFMSNSKQEFKLDFFAFFVPYAFSLIVEIRALVKYLNHNKRKD